MSAKFENLILKRVSVEYGKPKVPKPGALKEYHDKKRSEYSDFILLYYFSIIKHQCKYGDRGLDTLLEYINELEFRGLKYRL